jgi:radical SAM protein with 4Fe4S-binding SPASM domain
MNTDNDLEIFETGFIEDPTVRTGAMNGDFSTELMQQIPCTIGFTYTRFEVDGSVKPCCVSPFSLGNINDKSFEEIWHSAEYNAWRAKFLNIHKKKFHLHDVEFSFCQICPHIPINKTAADQLVKWDDEENI